MDIFPEEKRSQIMSLIKSKDTVPEKTLGKLLRLLGIPYKGHPKIPCNPDFLIKGTKLLIFADGDFWHGRIFFKTGKLPESNGKFWKDKILSNMQRDKRNRRRLRKLGYSVIGIWESDIFRNPQKTADKIIRLLTAKPPLSS